MTVGMTANAAEAFRKARRLTASPVESCLAGCFITFAQFKVDAVGRGRLLNIIEGVLRSGTQTRVGRLVHHALKRLLRHGRLAAGEGFGDPLVSDEGLALKPGLLETGLDQL